MPAVNRAMTPLEWTLLLALSVVWGGSFFFVGVAVKELPPLTIVALRVGLAALAPHAAILPWQRARTTRLRPVRTGRLTGPSAAAVAACRLRFRPLCARKSRCYSSRARGTGSPPTASSFEHIDRSFPLWRRSKRHRWT